MGGERYDVIGVIGSLPQPASAAYLEMTPEQVFTVGARVPRARAIVGWVTRRVASRTCRRARRLTVRLKRPQRR